MLLLGQKAVREQDARRRGGQLRVVTADPSIRKIFEITLLDRVFSLYETREAALERAASSG